MKQFSEDYWLEKEEHAIDKEYRLNKKPDIVKFVWIGALTLFLFFNCFVFADIIVICPECHTETRIESNAKWQIMPDTWVCPNPTCGYVNYDGIGNCGLC